MGRGGIARFAKVGLVLVILLVAIAPVAAQIPDEFTNLKVLPKEIGKRELVSIMRGFSGALGVRCKHCHVGKSADSLEGYDFASDDPEPKRVARAMMKMAGSINRDLLPATGRKSPMRVKCVTCHHGLTEPRTIDQLMLAVIEDQGVPAARARYLELREKYYGRGAYDFGPRPLNSVAETLAQEKQDVEGAISIAKLNVEVNPDAANSHLMLGRLYAASGDGAAAVAAIERSLELEPDNPWARQMLDRIKSSARE